MEGLKPYGCLMACVLVLSFAGSCRRDAGDSQQRALRQQVAAYGRLERTSQTRRTALREELARIADEGTMPSQLTATRVETADEGGPGWRRPGRRILDQDNIAAGLDEAFRQVDRATFRKALNTIYPSGPVPLDYGATDRVHAFRRRFQDLILLCQRALLRKECELGIQYTEGLAADLSIVEVFLWTGRLLGIQALIALAAEKSGECVHHVRAMLRLAELLAEEPHLTVRIAAARIREDAFRIIQVLCTAPKTTRNEFEQLADALQAQLSAWPADRWAWIGERAVGLHAYEMVRQGNLLSLMTYKEISAYDQKDLAALCREVETHVDEDELFYLTVMRRILTLCDRPYHERAAAIDQLRAEMVGAQRPERKRYVAQLLLARELDWGQRVQARDRALCEGWHVALTAALAQEITPLPVNPLTGHPYHVIRHEGTVYVTGVDVKDDGWTAFAEPLQVRLPK